MIGYNRIVYGATGQDMIRYMIGCEVNRKDMVLLICMLQLQYALQIANTGISKYYITTLIVICR